MAHHPLQVVSLARSIWRESSRKEHDKMETTWMCDNGYHGNAMRRSAFRTDEHGVTHLRFTDMYSGNCAGTVFHLNGMDDPSETDCQCECHNHADRQSFTDTVRTFVQSRADTLAAFDAEYLTK